MHIKELKLKLIDQILKTDQPEKLEAIWLQLSRETPGTVHPQRKLGWGKEIVLHIAEDFDETSLG